MSRKWKRKNTDTPSMADNTVHSQSFLHDHEAHFAEPELVKHPSETATMSKIQNKDQNQKKRPKLSFLERMKRKTNHHLPEVRRALAQQRKCSYLSETETIRSEHAIEEIDSSRSSPEAAAEAEMEKCKNTFSLLNKELDRLSKCSEEILDKLKEANSQYTEALQERNAHASIRTHLISLETFMKSSGKETSKVSFDHLKIYLEKCETQKIPDAVQKLIHACVQNFLFPNPGPLASPQADETTLLDSSIPTTSRIAAEQVNVAITEPADAVTAFELDPETYC